MGNIKLRHARLGSTIVLQCGYTVHMDINEATAKALSAERSAAHLTIKDLAQKSGVPERTLIRILKGERNINVMQVAQLSSVFGIYPHEIIESAERYIERDERGPIELIDNTPADSPVRADDALADRIAGAGDDAGTRDYYAMAAKRGDIDAEQQAYEELP